MIDLHRENLDDTNAEEIPEKYLKGIRVEANHQYGGLRPSKWRNQRMKDGEFELYGAREDCNHQIAALNSGVACTRCPGWYCA